MWKKGFVIENDTSGRNTVEKEMVSYIQQNFTGKISLRKFGEQVSSLRKNIYRGIFKEHFHITLSQYVTYLRLEHAKQLLQDTDIPSYGCSHAERLSECKLFYQKFPEGICGITAEI